MRTIAKSVLVVSLAFGAAALAAGSTRAADLGVNSNSNVGVTAPGVGVGVGTGVGAGTGTSSGGAAVNSGVRTQGNVATAPDNDASVKSRSSTGASGAAGAGSSGVRLQDNTNLNGGVNVR